MKKIDRDLLVLVCTLTLAVAMSACGRTVVSNDSINAAENSKDSSHVAEESKDSMYLTEGSDNFADDILALAASDYNFVSGAPIPLENRRGYMAFFDKCPSDLSDGYYKIDGNSFTVRYYDAELNTEICLCAQAGCEHKDESCQAWIGKVSDYAEYKGNLIATREYENGSEDLIMKDLATGQIRVLEEWKAKKDEYYHCYIQRIAENQLFIVLWDNILNPATGNEDEIPAYWQYDLLSGAKKQVFIKEYAENCQLLAYSNGKVLVYYIPLDQMYANPEETNYDTYKQIHGSDLSYEEWYAHYLANYGRDLRWYDLENETYQTIATEADGLKIGPGNSVYGSKVVYLIGNTIYLCDVATGEAREFLTINHLLNAELYDHKVFFCMSPEEEEYYYYFCDLDDPAGIVRYNNLGHTDVAQFSIAYEGTGFFIDTKGTYLSKEDYYKENYR